MKPKSVTNPDGVRFTDESETYNLTHLSPGKELMKYRFQHRDFIAHAWRWCHTAQQVLSRKLVGTGYVMDVGCGPEWSQLVALHSNACSPAYFLGMDIRDCSKTMPNAKSKVEFGQIDVTGKLPTGTLDETGVKKTWDIITCYEVLEHMPKGQGLKLLDNLVSACSNDTLLLFSTPCYNGTMSDNHIYEWTYEELKQELDQRFTIEDHFGTFASLKDYIPLMKPEELAIISRLKQYYNSAIISCMFAPLYPQAARNVLWQLKKK
jgi:hypothetical protein